MRASPVGVRWALPALILGLIAASYQLPPSRDLLLPVAALGAALSWLGVRRRFPRLALCLYVALFVLAGMSLYHLRLDAPRDPSHIVHFAGPETHRLEGRVFDLSRRPDGSHVADIEIGRLFTQEKALAVHGRVRLYLDSGQALFHSGQTVRFRSRLRRPRLFGTPGEFDYVRYLAARDIFVTGYVDSPQSVVPIIPAEGAGTTLLRPARQRERIGGLIDMALAPERAALVRALVIGDKKALDEDTRDLLSRSGLSHLFSVSGLHLGMTAALLYLLLVLLYRRSERLLLWQPPRRVLPLALLLPLWGYVLLTGAALPTQRAYLFFTAGALLLFLSRSVRPWRILEATAFLLLAIEPLALFEPSFQLSFAGVAGIIAALSHRRRAAKDGGAVRRFFAGLFLTTLVATLATLPLVAWHFHLLAPAGLLANLFAVPLVSFVALPLGLAGLVLCFAWTPGAQALFALCGWVLEGGLDAAKALVGWPALGGWPFYPVPGLTIGICLAALACILAIRVSLRRHKAALVLIATALLSLGALAPAPAGPAVTFFSVGQGDAALVSLSDGRHILVDGGGLYSERFDVGERLVLPALARMGVRRLEAVVLTHDHPDHRKGLLAVLNRFAVGEFLTQHATAELDGDLRKALTKSGVPVRILPPGWHRYTAQGQGDEEVRLFVPPRALSDENDRSIVLYLRCGRQGALLTGDLEKAGVQSLLQSTSALPVTLLKLPHHGSRYSRTRDLLVNFDPKAAVVSVGHNNPYRLPAQSLVEDVRRRGIPLYRTDSDGTVRADLSSGAVRVKRWERGLFR